MNEPLPGQKTNIVALVYTLAQGLAMAGVLPDEVVNAINPVSTALFTVTLALKAVRNMGKKG